MTLSEQQRSLLLLGSAFVVLLFGWPALLKGIGVYRWECIPDVFLGEYFVYGWLAVLSWIFHTAWLCHISGQGVARNWLPALILSAFATVTGISAFLAIVFTVFSGPDSLKVVIVISCFLAPVVGSHWLQKTRLFSHVVDNPSSVPRMSVIALTFVSFLAPFWFILVCATVP